VRMCFFFQAEDGIRGLTVTGVQTCALPICQAYTAIAASHERNFPVKLGHSFTSRESYTGYGPCSIAPHSSVPDVHRVRPTNSTRSEERRVGKECRSRRAPNP